MTDENPPRQCRCCRKPVSYGKLACKDHWFLLPQPLRMAIITTHSARKWKDYAANVKQADKLWQDAGLWKAGVPQS